MSQLLTCNETRCNNSVNSVCFYPKDLIAGSQVDLPALFLPLVMPHVISSPIHLKTEQWSLLSLCTWEKKKDQAPNVKGSCKQHNESHAWHIYVAFMYFWLEKYHCHPLFISGLANRVLKKMKALKWYNQHLQGNWNNMWTESDPFYGRCIVGNYGKS